MKKSIFSFSTLVLLVFAISNYQCKKPSPCDEVNCFNGGTCVNGQCDCPAGFSGPSCEDEIVPASIVLKTVKVKNFPSTDPQGGGWDADTGPDIYVEIERKNTNNTYTSVLNTETNRKDDADFTKEYSFSANSISLNPDRTYRITLYDRDVSQPHEEMDKKSFPSYQSGEKFPNPIIVSASNGTTFELTVEYKWQ